MLIRNWVWLLFILLLLIQMNPDQLHAGKFRKGIIALTDTSTSDPTWHPSQIFNLRKQALSMVEDAGDFIELMKTPFHFNDSNYVYRGQFTKLYEEFFNNHVKELFINKNTTVADMCELEDVLIFWPSVMELRARFLEAKNTGDLPAVLSIIKGTSTTIRQASELDSFFSVVIQRNTEHIVPLLLEATNKEWRQFSRLLENALTDERLQFFRYMLKKARSSEHVFRIVDYSHSRYGSNVTDLLISEIFTFNKKLVDKWQFSYQDYLKLLGYTHFYSTDLKIKILACDTVRTLHEYDELRNAGFLHASKEEMEKWQKSFAETCHLSADAFQNTVEEIRNMTQNENQQFFDAMPIEKKWLGKNCELCQETRRTFRTRSCQCVDKTNCCDKCIKHIVYNNLTPTCSLCRTPFKTKQTKL